MELLEVQPSAHSRAFPWQPLKIVPLGDLQVGSDGFDQARFSRFLDSALESNAYFLGMGDFTDFLSPSNRKHLRAAGLYDTAQELIEEWHMQQLDRIKEFLRPTKGRWLGMLQGHHYYEFDSGTTSDTELCRFLECPFLGDCALLRVSFAQPSKDASHAPTASVVLFAHHGAGGGASATSALTKLERFAGYVDADILLMGHQSKLGHIVKPRFGLSRSVRRGTPRLVNKTQHLVATGAWMEGYHVGSATRSGRPKGSYVEKAMLVPTALGGAVITLTPQSTGNGHEVDIEVTI